MQNTTGTSYVGDFPDINQLTKEICKTTSTHKIFQVLKKLSENIMGYSVGPQYVQTRSNSLLHGIQVNFNIHALTCL